ncbi:serine/threonine-protein kinase [Streptomyces sp. NPDC045431]|uniref:serine/threonine-protein kinase n=1 Tax=Streptomyces sp. NPDC045431 TaxID=3155613 RepID=UPI0033E2F0CB
MNTETKTPLPLLPLGTGDPLRLGPYRLVGVLGEGGMGKVYLAGDQSGRPAAVKVLRPELAHDRNLAQRFVREAHTARAVTSKGVARVLAAQVEGGRPWIATEFLAGPTLDQAVTAYGPLGEDAVRALAAALARTLQDVHAAGLVHRDVKPSNIVLTADGPRLIDFGIARPEHGLTLTTTGQIPVTPGYGAPEQVLGQRVTPAADVFSLGAVLVFAASGRPAYDGPYVAAVQYAVVHGQPDLGGLPPRLQQLVGPCLLKDAAFRPSPEGIAKAFAPTASARRVWRNGPWAGDIRRRETETRRLTAVARPTAGPETSRRRFLAWAGMGGAVVLAGGGASAWWLTRRDATALPPAGDAPAATPLREGEYSEGLTPQPLWTARKAAATGSPPTPVVLRDVVVFAAAGGGVAAHTVTDGKRKWSLPGVAARARQLPLNRDLFVAADAEGSLLAFDASTSERKWSTDADVALLLATSDDAVFVLTREGRLRAIDSATRSVRWTVPARAGAAGDPGPQAVHGSGRLVVSGTDGSVFALDAATGREVWRADAQAKGPLLPAVDGDTVYLGGRTLTARGLADGREIASLPASTPLERTKGGWGPPALDDDGVTAHDGGLLYRFKKDLTRSELWMKNTAATRPVLVPPVIQGNSIWVVEGDKDPADGGVSAFDKAEQTRMWTFQPDDHGPWAVAAGGNRVFLVSRGDVTAMPVF